jgi:hypothetical protein
VRVVYKYEISATSQNEVEMPRQSKFLHASIDPNDPEVAYLWYEVVATSELTRRHFSVIPTGFSFERHDLEWLATVTTDGLELVWHVYEAPRRRRGE